MGFPAYSATAANKTASNTAIAHASAVLPQAFGYLTAEALLEFCRTKLRGIDEQVQRAFTGQTKRNDISTALSELANGLSKHQTGIKEDDAAGKTEISTLYQKAIDQVGAGTELGKQLAEQKAAFDASGNGTSKNVGEDHPDIASFEMKGFMDSVQRMQGDVNREGELEMIQLQSLMSQRQQALQMCTNMIAGLGQSSQQIAANIGK